MYCFQLDENNVFFINDSAFRINLKVATGGRGAHLVLNCLSGDILRSSMDCCAAFGNLVHYGNYDKDDRNSIGMFKFILNISVYIVNLQNILQQSKKIKNELWRLVTEGIKDCVVRPLTRLCFDEHSYQLTQR